MKLLLQRETFSPDSTIGRLYVDSVIECFTLEDTDRKLEEGGEKIAGSTCIPRGTYRAILDYSQRFKRVLPRLLDVPNYVGVRIHPGNTSEDTEGCILPGTGIGPDRLFNSRAAFEKLFSKMEQADELGEEITIEIR
jgi:hypothetical protein